MSSPPQYSIAGDDAVTEGVTDPCEGPLCPALKALFEHGLEEAFALGGACHPWLFIEEVSVRRTPWSWWGGDLLSWTLWLWTWYSLRVPDTTVPPGSGPGGERLRLRVLTPGAVQDVQVTGRLRPPAGRPPGSLGPGMEGGYGPSPLGRCGQLWSPLRLDEDG